MKVKKKHLKSEDGIKKWIFDSGLEWEIPEEENRKKLILDCHVELSHRSGTTVYYELRKKYYWPGIKDQIREALKECETCQKYNRKTSGGSDFISTTRYLEKVGMDLIEFREEKAFVVVAVDYFTRRLWGRVLEGKQASEIVKFLKELCLQGKKPEELVTDNGKEFCNNQMDELCRQMKINHRKISIESHRSNGRIERIIRTVRESILKNKNLKFVNKVEEAIKKYNLSYHVGIKCTPLEASLDNTGLVMEENSPEGNYASRFKRWHREKFIRHQKVRVSKKENLIGCDKYIKGRFLDLGVIKEVCPNDSYIVRLENGRYVKKRHYDLKGIVRLL